jgi:hypothetical protein
MGAKEFWAAAAVLALVAAATLFQAIAKGGLFYDDWADSAGRFYPPGGDSFGNVMSYFWGVFHYRPVLTVYTPAKYFVFGADGTALLIWTALLGVIGAALLYAVLRRLSVPWVHALCIAALTLVFPWSDSIRLWGSANPAPLTIVLALGGFWLALIGVDRRDWRFHIGALVLYAVSILAYELTLPVIAVAGIVYWCRAGWSTAKWRWGADLAVVIAGAIWVRTHTTRSVEGLSADLTHLGEIVKGGRTIFARAFEPLGASSHSALVLSLAAIVTIVSVVVWARTAKREAEPTTDGNWRLDHWLLLALAGFVVAVLGWVVFIPADPYYTPSVFGITNRVNALAGVGLVILVYGLIGAFCSSIATLWPRARPWVSVTTVACALLLGAAYVHVLERHVRLWNTAADAQGAAIATMKHAIPRMPAETTVFAANYPAYESVGVPIFATTWDVNGMVKLEYDDGTLSGYPVIEGTELRCDPEGVTLASAEPIGPVPYGKALLLNFSTGQNDRPADRRACQAVVSEYVAGPMYLQYAY